MDENICSICYEEINNDENNTHTLECNHCYHSSCIIKWFRSGHSNCPLCNDSTLDLNLGYCRKIETIKEIKKIARKKLCPPNIKKTIEKIKKFEIASKNAVKAYNDFKKSNKSVYDMEKKLRKNKCKPNRQIRFLEYQVLSQITLNPIYIKN